MQAIGFDAPDAGLDVEQRQLGKSRFATVVESSSSRCSIADDLLQAWAKLCRDADADVALTGYLTERRQEF